VIKLGPASYYGEVQGVRTIDELTFSESGYPPGLRIPSHEHAHAFFCLVVRGACTEVIGARELMQRPSTLTYHPAGAAHSNHWHDPGGRCFHIEIAHAKLERARQHTPVLSHPAHFSGGVPSWLARRAYHEYLNGDDCSPLAIEGLVLEMLAEASRRRADTPERKPPRWLRQAQDFLDARFSEAITVGELAAEVGVDPDHMARVFRTHVGCTPGEYARKLRIQFACDRISSSDIPLVEIALEAGFSDQSHLTRNFKRHTGMTPAAFRALHHRRRLHTNG
jgi:AraC family transcriptional regulator